MDMTDQTGQTNLADTNETIHPTNMINKVLGLARRMISIVRFAKEDHDHVLRRRFERLHLYTLYSKHDRLIELDEELAQFERAVTPKKEENYNVTEEAKEQALKFSTLIKQIDDALDEFGMPFDLLERLSLPR
jgi:hypothetical protein